jgi:hypothetical protein
MKVLKARLPVAKVVLFGSYARGNYTVGSDIDVLIVYRGEPRDDAYAIAKKTLGMSRLEPHLFAEKEYGMVEKSISRMTAGGVKIL